MITVLPLGDEHPCRFVPHGAHAFPITNPDNITQVWMVSCLGSK